MPFQYGGIVRHDSKVLLYVMFRLEAVLKMVDFQVSSLCSQGNDHLEQLRQGEPHQRTGDGRQKGPPEDSR